MNTPTSKSSLTYDIVAKLWNLCNVLKDGGVTYHQYVTELTYLLFLKMAKETGVENQLPEGYRWGDLEQQPSLDRLGFYKNMLSQLGQQGTPLVRAIFAEAFSFIKKPNTLSILVTEIDKLDWYTARQEGAFGDLYEGLLEKNASEKKSGAGQYFTPRALIDCMVAVMKPTLEDVIQDPAAGTGGFLISASRYILQKSSAAHWSEAQQEKYHKGTFYGMEIVQDTHRMGLMNLMLHGVEVDPNDFHNGDTLSPDIQALPKATLILSNPPFGSKKGGGAPDRDDLKYITSNKQLCFLQHIYQWLAPGGRAAVILPDNVLFESNSGKQIRVELMEKCNLHTILRLPKGIFYAQGVNTSVLFFTRGETDRGNTREVWVYDMRASTTAFNRRAKLNSTHFEEFISAFGDDPTGKSESLARRSDTGETGRFRRFTREWVATQGDNLDISWLKDENEVSEEEQPQPAALAREALDELTAALRDLRVILAELGEEVEE